MEQSKEEIGFRVYFDPDGPDVLTLDGKQIARPIEVGEKILCPTFFGYAQAQVSSLSNGSSGFAATEGNVTGFSLRFCEPQEWDVGGSKRWKCCGHFNLKSILKLELYSDGSKPELFNDNTSSFSKI